MNTGAKVEEDHQARSNFMRGIVQRLNQDVVATSLFAKKIRKNIVQFWDNPDRLPFDVKECMKSWSKAESQGIQRLLFDKLQARDFILQKLGSRYTRAYDNCYHPAMLSDYFRLCYISIEGGCYIDADDVYSGSQIDHLFDDSRLKIQPLCYGIGENAMVAPRIFTEPGAGSAGWIFYFNNNPLIAGSGHPVIVRALEQATLLLEKDLTNCLPEIQSTTGPGNLTKSIFDLAVENSEIEQSLLVLRDWENIATSKWDLSYRNDARNWRLSNSQAY